MESDIITVNLERRDKISTKDLFSDIQVIPLETTPESLIRDITQIKFFEDRYYIEKVYNCLNPEFPIRAYRKRRRPGAVPKSV